MIHATLLAALLLIPGLAQASIIKVDFGGTFSSGTVAGDPFSGWFTYDTAGDAYAQREAQGFLTTPRYTGAGGAVVESMLSVVGIFGNHWRVAWEIVSPTPWDLSQPFPLLEPHSDEGFSFNLRGSDTHGSGAAFVTGQQVLAPTPEPSTLLLVLMGAVICWYRLGRHT